MIDTERVVREIYEEKLIAILRGADPDSLIPLAEALYEGGVRLIECTFDHRRSSCISDNCGMISDLARHFRGRMRVGAGTVLTASEAEAAVEAGAEFIISPNVDAQVIGRTRGLGAVSMPGALTPTEIVSAWQAGAHFVKLFPAGDLGPGYLKSVRAPLAHIPMLAVGGVTPENMPAFLKAGAVGFGVGSTLVPKGAADAGDWQAVSDRAAQFVRAAKGM